MVAPQSPVTTWSVVFPALPAGSASHATPFLTPRLDVTDLMEGNEYQFRVIAENKVGPGPEGPPSDTITAKDPWGPPGKPGVPEMVTAEPTSITLKWTRPKDDGGSEITNYVIEYKSQVAFKWKRGNDETVPVTTYQLKNLREEEVYQFRVAAENRAGAGPYSESTEPIKPEHRLTGKKPKLVAALKDVKVLAPKTATLTCDIEPGDPKAKATWYKEGKEVYESKKYDQTYSGTKAVLNVHDSELGDASMYTCEAVNRVGRVSTEGRLIVQALPKIDYDSKIEHTSTKAGSMFILQTQVSGYPTPTTKWSHNGKPLSTSLDTTVDKTADSNTLTVKRTSSKQSGKYVLNAENEVGTTTAEFNVTIIGKPS